MAACPIGAQASTVAAAGPSKGVVIKPVTDPLVNSPQEALRRKIFKDHPEKAACADLPVDPHGGLNHLDAGLESFLKQTLAAVRAKDDKALQPLFHKRLKVSLAAIQATFARLDSTYGAPLDVSVYKAWALNTVDGNPAGLACGDRLVVSPMYGYPLQFGVWLQVMGRHELGRIYLSLVPADGRWNLGAFHVQQWTHAGKDYAGWIDAAAQDEHKGDKVAAYAKYDLAQKLLDGGPVIVNAVQDDVIKMRDNVMKTAAWHQTMHALVKGMDVAYSSTLLVPGGVGVLLRIKVPGELSLEHIKNDCHKIAADLLKQPWGSEMQGVRCSYVLPREDPKKEGILGGIYLAFADLGHATKKDR